MTRRWWRRRRSGIKALVEPEPVADLTEDPDLALRQARQAIADIAAAARQVEPMLARLESHLHTNHIYDAVLASFVDKR